MDAASPHGVSPTTRMLGLLVVFAAWLTVNLFAPESSGTPPSKNVNTPAKFGDGDWPQFLGPDRNGISNETGLLNDWPPDGPPIVWRVPGGVGMSGFAVRGDRVVTMIQRDEMQWVVALQRDSGETLWSVAVAPEYGNAMGDGPRATPNWVGNQIFTWTGEGILVAIDPANGKILWSKSVVTDLGGKPAEYGMACSPLVIGDRVIVTAGAAQATVVALDCRTGDLVWKAGDDPAGYSSPALLELGGSTQIVAFTGASAIGLAPESGAVLWRYPYKTNFECNIATPLCYQGNLFLSAGENHGSVMLAVEKSAAVKKPDANGGGFQLRTVWESQGPMSVLRNEWQTSILWDDHLFGLDNVGGAGPITHLTCIDARTGQRVWQAPRFGKSNLIAADGKLFISTMKGELVVVRANPDEFEELGRIQLLGSTRQAPALSRGHLFLRDDAEILCLDVRKE